MGNMQRANCLVNVLSRFPSGGGGGGGRVEGRVGVVGVYSTKFYTGRIRPEVHLLPFIYHFPSGGGGGGVEGRVGVYSTKFYTGRILPEVHP